ncbi:MAG: 50S ribosomal protein L25 [Deltaproteobacteria bacterium]|nr:50S ribosomal protein L25 [Deltaproteobacteria bacterium]
METVEVPVEARQAGNKRDAGRLRRDGKLPGVVYGRGTDGFAVQVDNLELRRRVGHLEGSHLLRLKSEAGAVDGKLVLIKQIQYNPVTHAIAHIDFYEVDVSRKITLMVGLHFVGRPEGVIHGGVLQPIMRELEVECLPLDIPAEIEVDVSALEIGHSLKAGDITLPPNVVNNTPDLTLVSVLAPTVSTLPEEEEAEVEGEAAEEPTEGAGESAEQTEE